MSQFRVGDKVRIIENGYTGTITEIDFKIKEATVSLDNPIRVAIQEFGEQRVKEMMKKKSGKKPQAYWLAEFHEMTLLLASNEDWAKIWDEN